MARHRSCHLFWLRAGSGGSPKLESPAMAAHDNALTLGGVASQLPALRHRLAEPRAAQKRMQRETGRGRAGPRTTTDALESQTEVGQKQQQLKNCGLTLRPSRSLAVSAARTQNQLQLLQALPPASRGACTLATCASPVCLSSSGGAANAAKFSLYRPSAYTCIHQPSVHFRSIQNLYSCMSPCRQ